MDTRVSKRNFALVIVSLSFALGACKHFGQQGDEDDASGSSENSDSEAAPVQAAPVVQTPEEKRATAEREAKDRDEQAAYVQRLKALLKDRVKTVKAGGTAYTVDVDEGTPASWDIFVRPEQAKVGDPNDANKSPIVAWCAEARELVYWTKPYHETRLAVGSGESVRIVSTSNLPAFLAAYGCQPWEEVTAKLEKMRKGYDPAGYVALAGDMHFVQDPYLELTTTGLLALTIESQRKELVEMNALKAKWAAEKLAEEKVVAAWAKPTLSALFPLLTMPADRLAASLSGKAQRDAAQAKVFTAMLSKEIDRALASGRLATAAGLQAIQLGMAKEPVQKASAAELVAAKPVTAGERARAAAATLAALLVPVGRGDGEEAAALVRQLYGAGELIAGWPIGSMLKVTPVAGDASAAKAGELTLKVVKPWTGTIAPKVTVEQHESDTTSDETVRNPDYAGWLSTLEQYDQEIESMGGEVDRSVAASKRAQFVVTNTAVEGSYVRTNREETTDSLNRRSNAALGAMLGRMELRAKEDAREEHLLREPPQVVRNAVRHTEIIEEQTQTWEASIARSFVLSGLGPDQPIEQSVQGVLPARRYTMYSVGGKTKRNDFLKPERVRAEVKKELDDAVLARFRETVSKEIASRLAARDRELTKSIRSAEDRAVESAWARALFGLEIP